MLIYTVLGLLAAGCLLLIKLLKDPPMTDAQRQTGRTSRQVLNAPPDAIYIWPNARMHYLRDLAEKLGRSDLRLRTPGWLDARSYIDADTAIVIDHACVLGQREQEFIHAIRARGISVLTY